jgi:hypothetical protein
MSRSPFAESTRKPTSGDQVESYGYQVSFCEHPFPVLKKQKARGVTDVKCPFVSTHFGC